MLGIFYNHFLKKDKYFNNYSFYFQILDYSQFYLSLEVT